MKKVLLCAALFLIYMANPAAAKEGAYFEVDLAHNTIIGDDLEFYDNAYGINIFAGYDFGHVRVEGDWIKSDHQGDPGFADADFSGISVNILFPFPAREHMRSSSYLLAGYGIYGLDLSNGNEIDGNGFNLGLVMDVHLTERVSQTVRIMYRFIDYDEVNGSPLPSKDEGDVFTLDLGLKHHF